MSILPALPAGTRAAGFGAHLSRPSPDPIAASILTANCLSIHALSLCEERVPDSPVEAFQREMMHAGYAPSTISNYARCATHFLKSLRPTDALSVMSRGEIVHRVHALQVSDARTTEPVWTQALTAFFEMVYGHQLSTALTLTARRETLFSVLETRKIFASISTAKHRAVMLLIYAAGLSFCEAVSVLVPQAESISRFSRSHRPSDRRTSEPQRDCELAPFVEHFVQRYQPSRFLFEGREGGPYSERRLQQILQRALGTVSTKRMAGQKALRISFQKHLVEGGEYLFMLRDALRDS